MDQMEIQPQSTQSKNLRGIILVIALFFIVLLIFAAYTLRAFKDQGGDKLGADEDNSIAVVEVEGVIMDAKKTIENLQVAERDPEVKAVILRVNSPGGAVGPTQEIYEEIRRLDKIKPVYASFGAIAASGGYYIGSATRKIFSTPGTITGSIGVIMEFVDLSKIYEWAKVSQVTVKGGKYKDAGHPNRPLTDEEKALLKGMIDGVHQQFMSDIMAVRKKALKKPIETLAQGQIFSGEEALKNGLVDELAGLWEAARRIHTELKISGAGFHYIKKKKPFSLMDMLEDVEETSSKFKGTINNLVDQTPLLLYKF